MAPLERPEGFFLLAPNSIPNFTIEPLIPDSNNQTAIDNYIKGFIREYVTSRNNLDENTSIVKNNWTKFVKPWSSKQIFSDLENTALYKSYTFGDVIYPITCSVNFSPSAKDGAVRKVGDYYIVNFAWICENIGGQTTQKNYKIQIRVQSELDKSISGTAENLKKLSINPLGIQVTQYTVLDNKTDPLDSDVSSWLKI